MNLTPEETAYLDRFCYEVAHFLHGEGSVFKECPGQYQNLGVLTNFAPRETYRIWEQADRPAPPVVPFPWSSLEDIPRRRKELESVCQH